MLGEDDRQYAAEFEALSYGIDNGLTLIDTAEMYGDGRSEELIGDVIRPLRRGELFLVSKVYPFNASRDGIRRACTASLKWLGTDHLDLYLLHWPGSIPLEETVSGFEDLRREGLVRDWGVSNFDVADMEELWSVPGGRACATNQVLYNIGSRCRVRSAPLAAVSRSHRDGVLAVGPQPPPSVLSGARLRAAAGGAEARRVDLPDHAGIRLPPAGHRRDPADRSRRSRG